MASGWKRALHFLGLIEDYDEEYAEVGAPDALPPVLSEPPAAPRPEPSNVRRLSSGGDAAGPQGFEAPPDPSPTPMSGMSAPGGPAASRTVNVISGGGSMDQASSGGARTADTVHVTSPTAFNDVEEVGSRFRDGVPVLMNLQAASENTAKRLLDFASGLIYGLDGRIERTGDRIFLLTPAGVTVSGEERDRLADRGLLG